MNRYLMNKHPTRRDSQASVIAIAMFQLLFRLRPEGASDTSPGPANIVSAALGTPMVGALCPERAREMWLRPRTHAKRHNTSVPLQGTIITLRQTQGGARSGSLALG